MKPLLAALSGLALALLASFASADAPRSGTFTGASNHVTTGGVTLVETAEGWEIHLAEDFDFDGAPDPRIAFGKDGSFAEGTDFEPLRANTGAQIYQVPAGYTVADYDTIVLWCRRFSVPLGYAPLN